MAKGRKKAVVQQPEVAPIAQVEEQVQQPIEIKVKKVMYKCIECGNVSEHKPCKRCGGSIATEL